MEIYGSYSSSKVFLVAEEVLGRKDCLRYSSSSWVLDLVKNRQNQHVLGIMKRVEFVGQEALSREGFW